MLAEIPIISPIFQGLLDALGWILAWVYEVIPNYGVSIIVLTVVLRFLLFPLGMKQIKSMQAMQALQPKIKDIQKKYKNNRQKAQEETMRLYQEAGVNPLAGCLPVLAQFPLLIAMYAVLRPPTYVPVDGQGQTVAEGAAPEAYEVTNNHIPADSTLFHAIVTHDGTGFLGLNLQCSADQAGNAEKSLIRDTQKEPLVPGTPLLTDEGDPIDSLTARPALPCGTDGLVSKIGYVALLGVMIGTAFYQTWQTQRVSPQGSASSQQQMVLRLMPLIFGFISWSFPAGLVLYWTVSNLFMIGQQTLLLRAGHIGPEALERRMAEQKERMAAKATQPSNKKKGFIASMMERAEEERKRRGAAGGPSTPTSKPAPKGDPSQRKKRRGGK